MNSLRFRRYTQRRSPIPSPRASRHHASRLECASISENVRALAPVLSDHSSAGSLALPCNERSNRWIRFMPRPMRSRCHHTVLGPVFIAMLVFASGCSREGQELRRVRIATYNQGSLTALPLMLAERLGYFKSENLAVTIEETPSGAKAIQALLGGSAEVASAFHELAIQMDAQ